MVSRDADGREAGLARRGFLKAGALGVASVLGAKSLPVARAEAAAALPATDIAKLADIAVGAEISFDYPDENSPAVLLRLDGPAEGGIGPNNSIVAFSILCTHKGCPVQYRKDKQMLICPCHFSSFDAAKGGRIIIGQANETLPQINLRIHDDKVQAVGVTGLIFGRHANML